VARVFAKRYAGKLLHDHDSGRWYKWVGSHWQSDNTDLAFQFARTLGRDLTAGGKANELKEVRKVSFAGGVERFARGDRAFAVSQADWDKDPYLLGTPGGTVDLRTGQMRPADPSDRITKVTAVAPAETADCPTWLRFLQEVTKGDAGYIRFLQQWAGYCLTGDTSEQSLCFAFGPGGNGKGVTINTFAGIMGDYALSAAMETFTASKYDRHPTEVASLRGARLVTASETEEGRAWAESRIKQITGGDTMRARHMRQDEFEFRPNLKLLIIGNHKPRVSNVDDAMKRRLNLLPFLFKPENPDPHLEEKLKAEWPGILRWMLEGCLDWQKHRLVRPEVVKVATAEYFEAQDTMADWLAAKCKVDTGNAAYTATTKELFESWSIYTKALNEPPGTERTFSEALEKRGFPRNKHVKTISGEARGFSFIRLVPTEDEYRKARDAE
jgi:putative DNA primase/helicase